MSGHEKNDFIVPTFQGCFHSSTASPLPTGYCYLSGSALILKVTRHDEPKSPFLAILEVTQEGPIMADGRPSIYSESGKQFQAIRAQLPLG